MIVYGHSPYFFVLVSIYLYDTKRLTKECFQIARYAVL